ncbi:MAG: DUF1295 domain-containing protein [Pyrobaculum sp.]
MSIILTTALFYLSYEAPRYVDEILHGLFPDVFLSPGVEQIEALRPFGYLVFLATVFLIVAGVVFKKYLAAAGGSFALYLPIFSYFAASMFLLAGLGVLRIVWMPLLDISPTVLKLGCVVYLPFSAIPSADLVGFAISIVGIFIFSLGAATWLYGKFTNRDIVDFWIYRYSRHPQYLGYIVWSYGVLIYICYKPYIKGAFSTPPSLIWLATTLILISTALLEERQMVKKYGDRYVQYCKKTPFLLPLPPPLKKINFTTRRVGAAATATLFALIAVSYILQLTSFC